MKIPEGKHLILFDGVCNFCNNTINKIIAKDTKNRFVFASLQSSIGQEVLQHIGVEKKNDSIVLYQPGVAYYIKSDAALQIAKTLGGKYYFLSWLRIIPTFLRNIGYDYFAKNRYKWFGKQDACMIPSPEVKAKFLS